MMQFEAKVFMNNMLILLRDQTLLSDLYSFYVLDVEIFSWNCDLKTGKSQLWSA